MKKVLLVVLSMIMALSLLMPMVNPVSANTSIMANIAAQLLKDAGRSAIEVGLILRDNFSLDAWDTAQILNNVGYFAIEVGQVLKDIFGLSIPDAAEIMKEVGYSAEVVDRVLRDSTEVAQELKGSGSSSVEVGLVLRDEFMLDAQASAQILRGVGYSAIDIGQVLNDVFGLEARYGARIMKNLGYSAQETYEVLTSASAFGIDGTEEIEIENILRYAGYEDEEFMDITAFETVKKFTPILWFDQAYWGLPMSAQEYFDRVMNEPTNSPQMTQEYIWWTTGYYGPCPQWPDCSQCGMIPLCGRGGPEGGCVCGIENSDFNTLLNGEVPTYYHVISEPGGRLRIQYWWFYGWQGPCNTSLYTESDGAHHGDWERMIVTSSEGRQYVEAVTFIFHGDYYTRLKDNYLEQDGRPIAYVGKKAHGTYHNDDLSGYGGLGSALNCCEYADYRNVVDSSKWYNANDNLVSLNLNSEEWMLADRIGSTYEYNGQEYTIWNIHESSGTWRWGPCNWYETVTDVVCGTSCGTHPTIFPPVWWIPSCGGAGCGDSSFWCPDRDFDQGWPTFVFPPSQPIGISPPDGAENVVLNPTLESSDFEDLAGGTYQASQWQVTTTAGDYSTPVVNGTVTGFDITRFDLPSGELGYATTYYWHVRHKDNHGNCSDWSFEESFTTEEQLQAKFAANKTEGVAPLTVFFVDQSTGIHDSYLWEFGDGTTSTDRDCMYTYNESGVYTVSLTVSNSIKGTTDTLTKEDYITADGEFLGTPVDISMVLQGSSRPSIGWVVPVSIKVFNPGADVLNDTPLKEHSLTTTKWGNTAVCEVSIMSGTYDITVVSEHTLVNVIRNVIILLPSTSINMETLLEGNANDDGIVNISDFGILAISFGKMNGEPGYDARADFDRNGIINISDFGLLALNYAKMSPIEISGP